MKKIIVIGGGASGMMAAGTAAEAGVRVTLCEKNSVLGKKLRITGKGRCNITNTSVLRRGNLSENIPGNPYFLYSAFHTFDSGDTIEFFNSLGVATKAERGGRVYPVSEGGAGLVCDALAKWLARRGVAVRLNEPVTEIIIKGGKVAGVSARGGFEEADAVVVSTGGLSYPGTGSTGDGYKFARAAGHTVTKLYPSIVPLLTEEPWVPQLQGLSLKNAAIRAAVGGQVVYKDFGELLFTHNGVSGPVILSASRHLLGAFGRSPKIFIDLKPALDYKTLDKRLLRDFAKYPNKNFKNSLDDLLPRKLIPVAVDLSGIEAEKKVHDITKEERQALAGLLKSLPVTLRGDAGFAEAVITCGGVAVGELDPGTMESKLVKGLYFTGEVIDVDGYTGGFNLQIAFSTGRLAGQSSGRL
ncbi:MAG: NAD(P)/FAD-dependent oxidoreductase [Clostridiales bacterium]|jgi:predicted Rossmann fold flavoprotein|nr:NAD(P)/FAD-dependent oxidoreductase [Clostridiales bacterium]